MPVLKNLRWEAYAQALARGVPQVRAYTEAGFRPHISNPSAYANKPQIADRVEEIRAEIEALHQEANARAAEQFIAETALDQAELLRRLQRIAEIGDGTRTVKLTVADHTGETSEVEVSHLDLSQARQAYVEIGRQSFGMFIPKSKADLSINESSERTAAKERISAMVRALGVAEEKEQASDAGADTATSESTLH